MPIDGEMVLKQTVKASFNTVASLAKEYCEANDDKVVDGFLESVVEARKIVNVSSGDVTGVVLTLVSGGPNVDLWYENGLFVFVVTWWGDKIVEFVPLSEEVKCFLDAVVEKLM